jgi:hypothetical protein
LQELAESIQNGAASISRHALHLCNFWKLLVYWESTCSFGTWDCGGVWWRRVLSYVNIFQHLSIFEQMFINLLFLFSRDQGSKREMNEEERLLRLFCVVPKTMTDQMLRDHFKKFGDIDYVSVVKDRETKESKGFAYVKFHK